MSNISICGEEIEEITKDGEEIISFVNSRENYQIGNDIIVQYRVGKNVLTKTRDWVGIFNEDWSSLLDYCCYVWTSARFTLKLRQTDNLCYAKFLKELLLNVKPGTEKYQFVYVTEDGDVAGVSRTFSWVPTTEQSAKSAESDVDDDILGILKDSFENQDESLLITNVRESTTDKSFSCENARINNENSEYSITLLTTSVLDKSVMTKQQGPQLYSGEISPVLPTLPVRLYEVVSTPDSLNNAHPDSAFITAVKTSSPTNTTCTITTSYNAHATKRSYISCRKKRCCTTNLEQRSGNLGSRTEITECLKRIEDLLQAKRPKSLRKSKSSKLLAELETLSDELSTYRKENEDKFDDILKPLESIVKTLAMGAYTEITKIAPRSGSKYDKEIKKTQECANIDDCDMATQECSSVDDCNTETHTCPNKDDFDALLTQSRSSKFVKPLSNLSENEVRRELAFTRGLLEASNVNIENLLKDRQSLRTKVKSLNEIFAATEKDLKDQIRNLQVQLTTCGQGAKKKSFLNFIHNNLDSETKNNTYPSTCKKRKLNPDSISEDVVCAQKHSAENFTPVVVDTNDLPKSDDGQVKFQVISETDDQKNPQKIKMFQATKTNQKSGNQSTHPTADEQSCVTKRISDSKKALIPYLSEEQKLVPSNGLTKLWNKMAHVANETCRVCGIFLSPSVRDNEKIIKQNIINL